MVKLTEKTSKFVPNLVLMKKYLLIATLALAVSCAQKTHYIAISGYAQGGTYTVKVNMQGVAASPEELREGIDSILVLIDTTLSGYNKLSLLSRFNAGETIMPNTLFEDIYALSVKWCGESGGAFDVAAGPLYDAWGFGFKNGSMPSDEAVAAILPSCGTARLRPSVAEALSSDGTLSPKDLLLDDGALPVLNFNAIAQGYTADIVANWLRSRGVKDMLVDIGEIFCDGVNPSGKPWSVGVDRPEDGNDTPGRDLEGVWYSSGSPRGIVTSGNYRKFYVVDGVKYSHTIDPRTGYPACNNLLSATIVAPDATTADAVATWCMVIGLEEAKTLVEAREDLEGFLIYSEGEGMQEWASSGFFTSDL